MSPMTTRLIVSGALSLTGLALTQYWYKKSGEQFQVKPQGKPIARLIEGEDEIERKPTKRLLWQPIKKGYDLYKGDSVRTGPDSRGKILLDDAMELNLDENSLITFVETKKEITLDLISGDINVKKVEEPKRTRKNETKKAITLKVGDSKVTTKDKNTELSLSRDKEGKANVTALKGEAEIKTKEGQKVKVNRNRAGVIDQSGEIKRLRTIPTTYPPPNHKIDLGSQGKKSVEFSFKAPKAKGLNLYLEVGKENGAMKRIPISNPQKVSAPLPVGNFQWRVVGEKDGKVVTKSATLRGEAFVSQPPEILNPSNGKVFIKKGKNEPIPFSWRAEGYPNLRLQVAADNGFSKLVYNKTFSSSQNQVSVKFTKEQTYYARLLGENKKKRTPSKTISFKIEPFKKLEAPKITTPASGKKLMLAQAKKTEFKWLPMPQAEKFELKLKGPKGTKTQTTYEPKFQLKDPSLGQYEFTLRAIDDTGQKSPWAKARVIRIVKTEVKNLSFYNIKGGKVHRDRNDKKPKVELRWGSAKDVVSWQIRYSSTQGGLKGAQWTKTQTNRHTYTLPKEGTYYFEVEGHDPEGVVLARVKPKRIEVEPPEKLEAPKSLIGSKVKAKKNGDMLVKWQPIKGASSYLLQVKNLENKQVQKSKLKKPQKMLKELLPGKYEASLTALDDKGKEGEKAAPITIEVPNVSSITAPKVNIIQID